MANLVARERKFFSYTSTVTTNDPPDAKWHHLDVPVRARGQRYVKQSRCRGPRTLPRAWICPWQTSMLLSFG